MLIPFSVVNTGTVTIKNNTENGIHNKSTIPTLYSLSNITFVESCSSNSGDLAVTANLDQINISNSLVLSKDSTINDITKGNLSHQRYRSQDENTEFSTMRESRHSISLQSHNALCCKLSIVFAVCCIFVCFLVPFILYYVSQTTDNDEMNAEYSNEKNTSSAKVCCSYTARFLSLST